MKREFLMLAKSLTPDSRIGGWLLSEKLDGVRCFWDGGITKGMLCTDVPWANTAKDARLLNVPKATGLWTRYGKPIYAPQWFTDALPPVFLDGELYAGRGGFQKVTSTVKDLIPGEGWRDIKYMVFDSPPVHVIFNDGVIDNINYKKKLTSVGAWVKDKGGKSLVGTLTPFIQTLSHLSATFKVKDAPWQVHHQIQLPGSNEKALEEVRYHANWICERGGEGVMIRRAWSPWRPERSSDLLKLKPFQDSEGTVIGYTWGRETDKGSKLLGLMGNLVVEWEGKTFELSGFTNEERRLFRNGSEGAAYAEGAAHPGERCSEEITSISFPIGTKVTFKYRELTDAGIPKEARYWRKHDLV